MDEVLVTSSVMILGILCLRKLTMGKISMRVRYALWLLVVVRLLLPVSVGTSPVSVLNLLPAFLQAGGQSDAWISDSENGQTANGAGETEGWENAGKEEETHAVQSKENGAETVFLLQHPAQETDGRNSYITTVIGEAQKNPGISPVYVVLVVWLS